MDGNSYEKFKGISAEQLGVDTEQVTPDASFVDDLNADSLDLVELIMAFEEEYGMEIPEEDAEKIQPVGAAWDYVREKPGIPTWAEARSAGRAPTETPADASSSLSRACAAAPGADPPLLQQRAPGERVGGQRAAGVSGRRGAGVDCGRAPLPHLSDVGRR